METFRPCKYTNAVYKTADSSSTLQMSNRVSIKPIPDCVSAFWMRGCKI